MLRVFALLARFVFVYFHVGLLIVVWLFVFVLGMVVFGLANSVDVDYSLCLLWFAWCFTGVLRI